MWRLKERSMLQRNLSESFGFRWQCKPRDWWWVTQRDSADGEKTQDRVQGTPTFRGKGIASEAGNPGEGGVVTHRLKGDQPESWKDEVMIIKQESSKPSTIWDTSCEGLGRVWLDPFIPPTFMKSPLSFSYWENRFCIIYFYLVLFNKHLELTIC